MIWTALAFIGLLLVVALLAVLPGELPDRVWTHPGDPWCDKCVDGVSRFTFRCTRDGPLWEPGWCFNERNGGIHLGPPTTPLVGFLTSVEAEFNQGDHSYRGGDSYVPTGRAETIEGHRWTEYQRLRSP